MVRTSRLLAAVVLLCAVAATAADQVRLVVRSATAPTGVRILDRRGEEWLVEVPADLAGRWPDATVLREPPAPGTRRPWTPLRTADPRVQDLVAAVVWSDVRADLDWLVGLGVRYSLSSHVHAVADSLEARFAALGLETAQQDFTVSGHLVPNVIATQVGAVHPDSIYVLCAHFDATSEDPQVFTPGADDNASGSIAVLTAARLLARRTLACTVKYVLFGGEEQGLRGSRAWVQAQAAAGVAIAGALNFDMIGWWEPGAPYDLEIETNANSSWLAGAVVDAANTYVGIPYVFHVAEDIWWGDFYSFWEEGYPAVNHEEAWDWGDPDFNPRYHTTGDLVAYLDPDFTTDNVRLAVATLATVAGLAGEVGVATIVPAPQLRLRANPNPFNGRSTLVLDAPGVTGVLAGSVFDLRGRRVGAFTVPVRDGRGTAAWDAVGTSGRPLPAGTYLARVATATGEVTCRLAYVK